HTRSDRDWSSDVCSSDLNDNQDALCQSHDLTRLLSRELCVTGHNGAKTSRVHLFGENQVEIVFVGHPSGALQRRPGKGVGLYMGEFFTSLGNLFHQIILSGFDQFGL